MVELSNQYLTVNLHPKGAEIISIVGNQDHINYMWKRDACQWANSAPILFPIVGAIKNDTCRIDGKEYHMTQHGFARHNEFEIKNQSQTEVTFTLVSNDEIIKQYPFLFAKYFNALVSFGKQLPPYPIPALKKLEPILGSYDIPFATSSIFAPTSSQRLAISFIYEIFNAKKSFDAYLHYIYQWKQLQIY